MTECKFLEENKKLKQKIVELKMDLNEKRDEVFDLKTQLSELKKIIRKEGV